MPKEKQMILYLCRFDCGRRSFNYQEVDEHEKSCWCNPKLKGCMSCLFLPSQQRGCTNENTIEFFKDGWYPIDNCEYWSLK